MSAAAAVAWSDRAEAPALVVAAPAGVPSPAADLEALGASWWSALDAAESALHAAAGALPAEEIRERGARLRRERERTVEDLDALARAAGLRARFSYVLVSRSNLRRLLDLPWSVEACVFNLDGVLVDSAVVHAAAWQETFDQLIAAHLERAHGLFAPFNSLASFDPHTDYARYIHGRTRLEGVRGFLASRGISVPEGEPGDPPDAETVHGLANRKNEALRRRLRDQGVAAFTGARRYLEGARTAGIRCAVLSASANTDTILARAGLAELIDVRVDGSTIVSEHLRPRPAPDILLAACRRLGVPADRTAVFETSAAGVEAARAAGAALVFGVDAAGGAALRARGAERVVAALGDLLERDLAA